MARPYLQRGLAIGMASYGSGQFPRARYAVPSFAGPERNCPHLAFRRIERKPRRLRRSRRLPTVAHSLSAKKRIRQNEKRRARNRQRKDLIKTELKAFNTLVTGGDFGKAEEQLKRVVRQLDRTATKHTIHRKTASRKRSRLTRKLNVLRSKKTTTAGAGTRGAKA